MINEGIEPNNFLNDLLEIIYFIQQKKNIGNFDSDLSISESEQEIIQFNFKRHKYVYPYSFLAAYFKSY